MPIAIARMADHMAPVGLPRPVMVASVAGSKRKLPTVSCASAFETARVRSLSQWLRQEQDPFANLVATVGGPVYELSRGAKLTHQ